MSSVPTEPCWGFIIDTSEYSGNFERELCAHLTGQIGECGVGRQFIDDEIAAKFDGLLMHVPDEHGCHRPCSIWPTETYHNNGMGFYYRDGEEAIALQKYKEACIEEGNKMYECFKQNNPEYAESERERWHRDAKRAKKAPKHCAYNSVIIYFESKPTPELIDLIKSRCDSFYWK